MPRRLLPLVVAVVGLLAAGCAGDDGSSDAETGSSAALLTPDSIERVTTTTSTPVDPGTCQVDVTGDVSTQFTSAGGVAAVGTEYWLSAEQKAEMASPSATAAPFFFILNCTGADGSGVSIATGPGGSTATIPFAPATYSITPAENRFGGGGSGTDPLSVLINLAGAEASWGLTAPGTVTITRFDAERIAGTFSFPITDALAGLQGRPGAGSAQVNGTFDLANPATLA